MTIINEILTVLLSFDLGCLSMLYLDWRKQRENERIAKEIADALSRMEEKARKLPVKSPIQPL